MEVRMPHQLEPAEVARRIRAAAERLELEPADDGLGSPAGKAGGDALRGTFTKASPLGAVTASWSVTADEVVVEVLKKPAFLPASTVARLLEDGLKDTLANG